MNSGTDTELLSCTIRCLSRNSSPCFLWLFLAPDCFLSHRQEFIQRLRFEVLARSETYRDRALFLLAISDHEHVGNLLHLRIADLRIHALHTCIDLDAQAGCRKAIPRSEEH